LKSPLTNELILILKIIRQSDELIELGSVSFDFMAVMSGRIFFKNDPNSYKNRAKKELILESKKSSK
jgi:hypothetical protein